MIREGTRGKASKGERGAGLVCTTLLSRSTRSTFRLE
jgi:hypothetical protein